MNDNKLGIYLQTLRKQKGYTQEFVAQKIGVIRQTYSHYETGRMCPPIAKLCQLADLYAIPAGDLLEEASEVQERGQEMEEVQYQLSKNEQELVLLYRLLDERGQEDAMALVNMLAKKGRNKR